MLIQNRTTMDYTPFEQPGPKCLVCGADNLLTFIDLTLVTARTSQSNIPVRDKLKCIIKHKWLDMSDVMILCTPCFNMVERYDQLESELLQIEDELSSKYVHTFSPDNRQSTNQTYKRIRREGRVNDHESTNWQQQVPVDLLQPVINLTADEDDGVEDLLQASCDTDDDSDSDSGTFGTSSRKPRRALKKKEEFEGTLKCKKSSSDKLRGRLKKDLPLLLSPTSPSFPSKEESKDKIVFEYDYTCPFFKEGERIRTGQILVDELSQTSYMVCIYCTVRASCGKDMNSHMWSTHKPHIMETSVPSEDGHHHEHNFGVQLVRVASDSQALGRHFICIFCDSTFKFKSNLLQHFRENHSPYKPFSCMECKAKFRRSIEMSRHRVYYCPNKKPIPGGRNNDNLPSH